MPPFSPLNNLELLNILIAEMPCIISQELVGLIQLFLTNLRKFLND